MMMTSARYEQRTRTGTTRLDGHDRDRGIGQANKHLVGNVEYSCVVGGAEEAEG